MLALCITHTLSFGVPCVKFLNPLNISATFCVNISVATTTDMNKLFKKHQILESLNDLDLSQTDQVLAYVQRLVRLEKEREHYAKASKREAMTQIRNALKKGRILPSGF